MKHLIFVIVLLIMVYAIGSAYSYAMKCPLCIKDIKTSRQNIGDIGIAQRDFETPIIHKDGRAYATYKCEYGHKFLVELK